MKKLLRFEIKHTLRKPSRIYVKSPENGDIYGHFYSNNPSSFDGWGKLSQEQTSELVLFIQNITAVNKLLGKHASSRLIDFRFRLPTDLIDTINELSALLTEEKVEFNIFEAAITGMIQQLKIATTKLPDQRKLDALAILDKSGLAEYKKLDLNSQIQAVFTEILAIQNKSEKLHEKALMLFTKDKSYSPKAIEGMAKGDTIPAKWLVACAIDLLIDERLPILKTILSENDLFLLWAKQLLDNGYRMDALLTKIDYLNFLEVKIKTINYFA